MLLSGDIPSDVGEALGIFMRRFAHLLAIQREPKGKAAMAILRRRVVETKPRDVSQFGIEAKS